MSEIKYDTKKLHLAQVRYFETEMNAVEVLPPAYAILWEGRNKDYYNVFNLTFEAPVYKRVPYSNTTMNGEDYGSKIMLESGEVKDGICYVLDNFSMADLFQKDEISYDELSEYVMKSDKFFVDRISLFKEEIKLDNMKYIKKIMEDLRKISELNDVFKSHDKDVVYRKR